MIKDPFVLEFLDLKEPVDVHERDVEQVVIDRLEDFLLELGKGTAEICGPWSVAPCPCASHF